MNWIVERMPPGVLGFGALLGAVWLLQSYERLHWVQSVAIGAWVFAGLLTSFRYIELSQAAEDRGFAWMRDRLREASREKTRRIIAGEEP